MTARHDRLTRLLVVRTIQLKISARALATAAAAAVSAAATATRLGALRAELRGHPGDAAGYAIKAAAATREVLVSAESRQRARLVDAEARRSLVEGDFRHRRAGVDATARAAERAHAVAPIAGEPT